MKKLFLLVTLFLISITFSYGYFKETYPKKLLALENTAVSDSTLQLDMCVDTGNIQETDNLVFYNLDGSESDYIAGHNNLYNTREIAELFNCNGNKYITGIDMYVGIAEALSTNARITVKVWSSQNGKPGVILYSENVNISDLERDENNFITFDYPVQIPSQFFAGFQLYYSTPRDNFAVYQAASRGTESAIPATMFIKTMGQWYNINDLYEGVGGFNTSLAIYPRLCYERPDADFTADINSGCDSLTVQFTDQSSQETVSWEWDFGDGSPVSTMQNPVHTYTTPGLYTVSLTISNGIDSDTEIKTNHIEVIQTPGDIVISEREITKCGGNVTLNVLGGENGIIYWQGTQSNGSSTLNPTNSQVVEVSGIYYFRAANNGCWGNQDSIIVTIYDMPTVDLGEDIEECASEFLLDAGEGFSTYFWNGTSGNQTLNITESGTYKLVVSDENGCTASDDINITLKKPVEFTLSMTPETGLNANNGTATVQVNVVESPYSIIWSNGDATESITGLGSGNYSVTVSGNNNCSADSSILVTLESAPVANFSADITNGCDNLEVQFTDMSLISPSEWLWDFGDGNTSTDQNPVHIYANPGIYTVSLEAVNNFGSDIRIRTNYIIVGETPLFDYRVTDATGQNADGSININVIGNDFPYQYEWSHDNENDSPLATGLMPGIYNITVTGSSGCFNSDEITVRLVDVLYVVNEDFTYGIFPNPAVDILNIKFENILAERLEIVNTLGEIIYRSNIVSNDMTINVSEYKSGVYFVNLYFKDEILKVNKIIIK